MNFLRTLILKVELFGGTNLLGAWRWLVWPLLEH